MKIGIINFDIGSVGGIATHSWEFKQVLDRNEYDNEIINIKQTAFRPKRLLNKIVANKGALKIGGIYLSISDKHLNQTLSYLNKFDVLFYTNACIHDENANW